MVIESLLLPFVRVQRLAREESLSDGLRAISRTLQAEDSQEGFLDERTFRHFVAAERSRAAMADSYWMLMLISVRPHPVTGSTSLTKRTEPAMFSVLAEVLREVDLVGWYREGHVVGAVMPQGAQAPADDSRRVITRRVKQALKRRVSTGVASRLRVRVLQLRGSQKRAAHV